MTLEWISTSTSLGKWEWLTASTEHSEEKMGENSVDESIGTESWKMEKVKKNDCAFWRRQKWKLSRALLREHLPTAAVSPLAESRASSRFVPTLAVCLASVLKQAKQQQLIIITIEEINVRGYPQVVVVTGPLGTLTDCSDWTAASFCPALKVCRESAVSQSARQ